jgi:hypothetical protein
VTDKQDFNRLVRRTAFLTVALVAALVFGIAVLAGGDWLPGGITVAAALVGLAGQMPVISRLRGGGRASSSPASDPTGPYRHHQPPTPRA